MTLSLSGYTVGANAPLTHARILWAPISGVISGDGAGAALAGNDYTYQRWQPGALPATWTLTLSAPAAVDTLFIAAHTLGTAGASVAVQTSATLDAAFTTRATLAPADNSTIAVMFNTAGGALHQLRRVRLALSGGAAGAPAPAIGIIRWGVALQMARPIFGGAVPIGLARAVETRHAISETGQWLGRTIQRQARRSTLEWQNLPAAWYRAAFAPFAETLPQRPFGLIQNPARMPESVAWCWTDDVPQPSNMGLRDLMQVSLSVTGFLE